MDISEILGGADAPVEPVSTVETPAPETPAAEPATTAEAPTQPRDDRGRFASPATPEPVAETPQAPPTEERQPHMVPVSAMLEERRKRQELEARLQAAQPPPVEIKDEDYWTQPLDATRKVVQSETAGLQFQIREMKYNMAEDFTRQMHQDFDDVKQVFVEKIVANDPWALAVAQQLEGQRNPAKFMYDAVKKLTVIDQVGDLSSFESRIRAEERAKVLAEISTQRKPPPEVPRSLNAEPSAPSPSTPSAFEPTPLGNLIPNLF